MFRIQCQLVASAFTWQNARIAQENAADVKGGLQQIERGVQDVKLSLEEALSMLRAQRAMLMTLLSGVDKLAPKLIVFLPADDHRKSGAWVKNPKDWLNQRVKIFFFDPIRLSLAATNGGEGFEIVFPKTWVARALPYVKVGLTVLKVAAVAGKLSGIPFPDVKAVAGEWVDAQLQMVLALKSEAFAQMSALTSDPEIATQLLEEVEGQCTKMLSDKATLPEGTALGEKLRKPLEKSVGELDALLPLKWKDNCGLKMVTANDGSTEWVLPEDADQFKREGFKMLPGKLVAASEPSQQVSRRRGKSLQEANAEIVDFLLSKCSIRTSTDALEYADALCTTGYDSVGNMMQLLEPDSLWPDVFSLKPAHKKNIEKTLSGLASHVKGTAHGEVEVHSGWMLKRGEGGLLNSQMHKRFFVLYADCKLYYYAGSKDRKLKGHIDLNTATALQRTKYGENNDYTFVITTSARDWVIKPDDRASWEEWQAKLRPMLKRVELA